MAGYYLLNNRDRDPKWYTSRRGRLVGIVVHCTAGLDIADEVRRAGGDWAGVDRSAERTAEWCASSDTASSWHSGSDWDSVLDLLPASHVAWHCRGYNTHTYGHEISKADMSWGDEHEAWVAPTLRHAAGRLRRVAAAAGIPVRKISRAQLDRAIAAEDPSMGGFVGHRELDPSRRTDPGADFPWSRFLTLVRRGTPPEPEDDMPLNKDDLDKVERRARLAVRSELGTHMGGAAHRNRKYRGVPLGMRLVRLGNNVASLAGDHRGLADEIARELGGSADVSKIEAALRRVFADAAEK